MRPRFCWCLYRHVSPFHVCIYRLLEKAYGLVLIQCPENTRWRHCKLEIVHKNLKKKKKKKKRKKKNHTYYCSMLRPIQSSSKNHSCTSPSLESCLSGKPAWCSPRSSPAGITSANLHRSHRYDCCIVDAKNHGRLVSGSLMMTGGCGWRFRVLRIYYILHA